MSKFCGKCDFYDTICIYGEDKIKNYTIYIGNSDTPLEFDTVEDLIPYYAHIVSMAYFNNNKGIIKLSSKSYVDTMEEERLKYEYESLVRYYKKCKRKKIEFNIEDAVKQAVFFPHAHTVEMAKRVKENGTKKFDYSDIKLEHCEYYRNLLKKELEKVKKDT